MPLQLKLVGPGFQGAANTAIADESGNARHATLLGGDNTSVLQSTDRPGIAGVHSLHLNAVDDYFTFPSLLGVLGDNATVMAWVKLDVATPAGPATSGLWNIGAVYAGNSEHHPYTGGTGYYPTFRGSNNTTVARIGPTDLSAGGTRTNWNHVCITTAPGANGWKLIINNTLITQATGITGVYYDNDLWCFGQSSNGGFYFDGFVWDFRVYDETITNTAPMMAEANAPAGRSRMLMGVGI